MCTFYFPDEDQDSSLEEIRSKALAEGWELEDIEICGYHATPVSIEDIKSSDKGTMFFTRDREIAREWGVEHYEKFHIVRVWIPLQDVIDVTGMGTHQFEMLENYPEKMQGEIIYNNDVDYGFIVKNVQQYQLKID